MRLVGLKSLNRTKAKLAHLINGNDTSPTSFDSYWLKFFICVTQLVVVYFSPGNSKKNINIIFTCFSRNSGSFFDKSKDWSEKYYISAFFTSGRKKNEVNLNRTTLATIAMICYNKSKYKKFRFLIEESITTEGLP